MHILLVAVVPARILEEVQQSRHSPGVDIPEKDIDSAEAVGTLLSNSEQRTNCNYRSSMRTWRRSAILL